MSSPSEQQVTVPDVVGLTVRDGQARAGAAGVTLAQPDPDGPPLSALTWPHADRFRILEQRARTAARDLS